MTAPVGQADVEENEVVLPLAELAKRVLARRAFVDVISSAVKDPPQKLANLWIVVDDEHLTGRRVSRRG
jgi:hypothetical protein